MPSATLRRSLSFNLYSPILEELLPNYEHNLFWRDFNVNLLVDSRETLDFCDKIEDHGLSIVNDNQETLSVSYYRD
jgi:hypothetical protein